jgi:hypothetical protein
MGPDGVIRAERRHSLNALTRPLIGFCDMGLDRIIDAQRRYVLRSLTPQKIAFGLLTRDHGHTQDQAEKGPK